MYSRYKKKNKSNFTTLKKNKKFSKKIDSLTNVSSVKNKSFIAGLFLIAAIFGLSYEHVYLKHLKRADLKTLTKCLKEPREAKFETYEDHHVFYNFILGSKRFECDQSVTFATHVRFDGDDVKDELLSIEDAVLRYDGPFSVSIYLRGDQFYEVTDKISYLRNCKSKRIRKMVSFHLIFKRDDLPKTLLTPQLIKAFSDDFNCFASQSQLPQLKTPDGKPPTVYPLNLAENVAKRTAQTHFVFVSRIDLSPPENLPGSFLKMLKQHPQYLTEFQPGIFVLPAFQIIDDNAKIPVDKTELKANLLNGSVKAIESAAKFPDCNEMNVYNYFLEDDSENDSNEMTVISFDKKRPNLKLFYIAGRNLERNEIYSGGCYFLMLNRFLIHK